MATDRRDPLSRRRFLGLTAGASGAVALALAGCSLERASAPRGARASNPDAPFAGELVDPGLEKPDVTFTDLDGEPFPFRERTDGRFSILFFGYTSCPDICPIYLTTLRSALEAIGTGPGSKPMVLFVGVDTARDTPEQMRTYLDRVHPGAIGLTGPDSVIAEANRQLFLPPITLEEPDEDGEYLVGHSSRVFPFLADNLAHRLYDSEVRQQEWVRDLPRLDEGQYR